MIVTSLKCFLVLLASILLVRPTSSSMGDLDPHYRHCVSDCRVDKCDGRIFRTSSSIHSGSLKLVQWDCIETCGYDCMTEITHFRTSNGYSVLKYFGHWPFNRLLGLEEPASVVFSALNFVPHAVFLARSLLQKRQEMSYYMSSTLVLYALCACNAWVASTMFHSKKTEYATQYDYISALIFLCSGLWVAIRRWFGSETQPLTMGCIFGILAAACISRVNQMIRGTVSFDSHMQLCIGIVIVTTTVWVLWVINGVWSKSYQHKWICLGCQLWLIAASALEIFDFPPYFELFDAHSLWHAATIPLGFIWYDWFWKRDYEEHYRNQQPKCD